MLYKIFQDFINGCSIPLIISINRNVAQSLSWRLEHLLGWSTMNQMLPYTVSWRFKVNILCKEYRIIWHTVMILTDRHGNRKLFFSREDAWTQKWCTYLSELCDWEKESFFEKKSKKVATKGELNKTLWMCNIHPFLWRRFSAEIWNSFDVRINAVFFSNLIFTILWRPWAAMTCNDIPLRWSRLKVIEICGGKVNSVKRCHLLKASSFNVNVGVKVLRCFVDN